MDASAKLVWAKLGLAFPSVLTGNSGGSVYALEFVPPNLVDAETFLIYWVEYKSDGDGVPTWLGWELPLMFTAIMSGCSFGLGSATMAGVRAAHVNSMSKSQTGRPDEAQLADQHTKLVDLDLTQTEITPANYVPGVFDVNVQTTPFGTGRNWLADGCRIRRRRNAS